MPAIEGSDLNLAAKSNDLTVSVQVWVIAGGLSVIILVATVVLALAWYVRRRREQNQEPRGSVTLPTLQPCEPVLITIQPNQPQPSRLTRKLQERRGPGSLRLSLANVDQDPSPDRNMSLIQARKRSAEAALFKARKVLTRSQLKQSMSDARQLYTDFWSLPTNHPEAIEVPGSGFKNRYKTILPNETTRVVLPEITDDPLSSYINANYISGFNESAKTYIATQGPMPHTTEDFWRMVWCEHVPAIVMLTRLQDKNKTKCTNYLPDSPGRHVTFGNITILCEHVTRKEGYLVFDLLLKNGRERRRVRHFWDCAWNDHRAPRSARQLLNLVSEVHQLMYDADSVNLIASGPLLVHCSAGIGRTGCFIAISIGSQQLRAVHQVDVLGIVARMRLERGGMVQTHEQYQFIHQALILFESELPDSNVLNKVTDSSQGNVNDIVKQQQNTSRSRDSN